MKYLKTYEFVKNQPQKGDYVLIKVNREKYKEQSNDEIDFENLFNTLDRKIGKIITINKGRYIVEYQLGKKINWRVTIDEIVKYSKNKEDLSNLISSGDPEKDDFVIISINPEKKKDYTSKNIEDIENSIGVVVGLQYDEYKIKFKFGNYSRYFYFERDEILDFSKNKEDLQYYFDSMKYNL